ncbi:unnamed protein product, partial [Phaeothamnion confervicola]
REEAAALRRVASRMAREVHGFWGKVNKVIAYRQKVEADATRRKAMDRHLVFLVKQTERYSSMLVHVPAAPATAAASAAASPAGDRSPGSPPPPLRALGGSAMDVDGGGGGGCSGGGDGG